MNIAEEFVILVDQNDQEVGQMEKLAAHEGGRLHRAFSVCVFNYRQELLLQQRAWGKYHSAGLWTNTCCSHPRLGESLEKAAHRRLQEEMGFDCELKKAFVFTYKVEFDNGLTEFEKDYVFVGKYNGEILPDPKEVEEYKWVTWEFLLNDMKKRPEIYTYWFKEIVKKDFFVNITEVLPY